MAFIDQAGDQPWVAHVSYIKPHWPYIVPELYASMYGPEHVLPAVRADSERDNPHPVYGAMMDHRVSKSFSHNMARSDLVAKTSAEYDVNFLPLRRVADWIGG